MEIYPGLDLAHGLQFANPFLVYIPYHHFSFKGYYLYIKYLKLSKIIVIPWYPEGYLVIRYKNLQMLSSLV